MMMANNNNNTNNCDDNDRLSLTTLPLSLHLIIVNYLGAQEDLTTISVLSKQFYKIVHLPAIATKIIRLYEITPRSSSSSNTHKKRGSERNLLKTLVHNRVNNNEKLSQYHHVRFNGINEFDYDLTKWDANDITNNVPPLNNIEVLVLSMSSASATSPADARILYDMRDLLSNVQEINLSSVRFGRNFPPQRYHKSNFFHSLTSLQKVTWNHCDQDLSLTGIPFHPTRTKEIFSDNSLFIVAQGNLERMLNLEQHDDNFMFYCCKSLECLSIRNAKYTHTFSDDSNGDVVGIDIPQNILIKFVRNAPLSMRWFRSDLTKKNMVMLKQERPEIQLLN